MTLYQKTSPPKMRKKEKKNDQRRLCILAQGWWVWKKVGQIRKLIRESVKVPSPHCLSHASLRIQHCTQTWLPDHLLCWFKGQKLSGVTLVFSHILPISNWLVLILCCFLNTVSMLWKKKEEITEGIKLLIIYSREENTSPSKHALKHLYFYLYFLRMLKWTQ